jgi:Tfp pilus assembly protein PilO
MGTRHADRIWMIGGVALAALLLAAGWFFAISPKNAEADDVRGQSELTETRLITLRHRLAELEEQKSQLAKFQAQLASNKAALPTDSGVPDFLRQLQNSGDAVAVTVSGVTVNSPELQPGNATIYALPITVTADGTADNLGRFLNQLQAEQPRAVLIESANMAAVGDDTKPDQMTVTVTLKAFVAPGAGQPVPTVATTS